MNGQLINHFLVSTLPGPGNPKESNLNLHHVCRDPFPNVKNLELIALDLHFPAHLKYLTWLAATLEFNSHTRCCVPSITLGGLFSFLSRLAEQSIDTREIPQQTRVNVCLTTVSSLWFPDPPVRDARLVAKLLGASPIPSDASTQIFFSSHPYYYRPLEEYEMIWEKVNRYIPGGRLTLR